MAMHSGVNAVNMTEETYLVKTNIKGTGGNVMGKRNIKGTGGNGIPLFMAFV